MAICIKQNLFLKNTLQWLEKFVFLVKVFLKNVGDIQIFSHYLVLSLNHKKLQLKKWAYAAKGYGLE